MILKKIYSRPVIKTALFHIKDDNNQINKSNN